MENIIPFTIALCFSVGGVILFFHIIKTITNPKIDWEEYMIKRELEYRQRKDKD